MTDNPPPNASLMNDLNLRFARIAGWCFDHRWIVSLACLLLFAASAFLASGVEQDASYEAYFYQGDTTFQAYEAYREDFGSDEVSYIGYELPGVEHGPWNVRAMEALVGLTEALEDEVPFAYEVTTLANAELTIGSEDGIEIRKIRNEWPLTQEELLQLRDAFARKPLLVGGIINDEADFGAIIIEMDRSSTDAPEDIIWDPDPAKASDIENLYPQVTDAKIEEILGRPAYQDFVFFHSGDVPLNAFFNRVLMTEWVTLLLMTLAVISAILLVSFRSLVSVLAPGIVLLLSVSMTFAFMAVFGFKMGMSSTSLPTIILAIGVAHSVHILAEFRSRLRKTGDRRESLVQAISLVGVPCLLTSVTTAVGFVSMGFVPIKSLAQGALTNAFGVLAAFFFSITLLMALLSIGRRTIPVREKAGDAASRDRVARLLDWVADVNIRYQNPLLAAFVLFLLVFGVGISKVEVDTNWLSDFWETSKFHQTTVRVDQEMGGTTNIIYLFDAGAPDAIKEPAVLREIERLQERANEEDWLVRKSYSIVDIVKDLNQSLHGDDPDYHRIPETREAVAQYLLLYESSGGEEVEEFVSSDYQHANLELRLKMGRIGETAGLIRDLEASLEEQPLEKTKLTLTGIGALWLKLMDYIVTNNIQGITIAFCAISLVMIAIFRSVKIGLISMVPNLAPVFLALGAMGWLDITLDYNKVSIAAIALGISVDDTIHLMTRFHHEFGIHGNYRTALRSAMGHVGRALVITSIALVLGFLVLVLSDLRSQAYYGILLSGALVAALVADFFFMPALVLWLKPFGPEGEGRAETIESELREAA